MESLIENSSHQIKHEKIVHQNSDLSTTDETRSNSRSQSSPLLLVEDDSDGSVEEFTPSTFNPPERKRFAPPQPPQTAVPIPRLCPRGLKIIDMDFIEFERDPDEASPEQTSDSRHLPTHSEETFISHGIVPRYQRHDDLPPRRHKPHNVPLEPIVVSSSSDDEKDSNQTRRRKSPSPPPQKSENLLKEGYKPKGNWRQMLQERLAKEKKVLKESGDPGASAFLDMFDDSQRARQTSQTSPSTPPLPSSANTSSESEKPCEKCGKTKSTPDDPYHFSCLFKADPMSVEDGDDDVQELDSDGNPVDYRLRQHQLAFENFLGKSKSDRGRLQVFDSGAGGGGGASDSTTSAEESSQDERGPGRPKSPKVFINPFVADDNGLLEEITKELMSTTQFYEQKNRKQLQAAEKRKRALNKQLSGLSRKKFKRGGTIDPAFVVPIPRQLQTQSAAVGRRDFASSSSAPSLGPVPSRRHDAFGHASKIDSGKGFELLKKMGWKGKGLGKDESGIVNPIAVAFKNDKKGLGAYQQDQSQRSQLPQLPQPSPASVVDFTGPGGYGTTRRNGFSRREHMREKTKSQTEATRQFLREKEMREMSAKPSGFKIYFSD